MSASIEVRIAEHVATPKPHTSPAYDQAPLGHRAAMIRMRDDILEEDMSLRRRFVLTAPPPGYDVAESSVAVAARPPKAADRAEDVGYVCRRESEDFYTQLHDAWTDRGDIRLEIDVVRGQRTTYETELHEDDASQSSGRGLRRPVQPMESVFYISGCAIDNQVKFPTCTLLGDALTWWNGRVRTLGHDAAYAMTWGTLKKKLTNKYYPKGEIKKLEIELWNLKTEKVDKYISGLPDNIHGNVMSERPKILDDFIELANDLMDHKLRTYAERQNDNKRKADDSSRNNQQPHKKQNVARAYTAGPGEKKAYTGNLPLCTKCNYHHTRQCAPKCGNYKRYGHTTHDCRVNTNKNKKKKKNQKAGACYECGNTRHIKKSLCFGRQRENGNGNGVAQGRAYALGGRDASPDSNVITGTFLLNNCYAIILFDTGTNRSFVSNKFSAMIDITPTTLENHYDVELADRKIIGVNTIIRGCTLNFMNHPFNIDLMPVLLGSFDVIIGMDWLTK
ncbi:putative reverse transcriptase domain-containing protein [Tanacetum coccineum]